MSNKVIAIIVDGMRYDKACEALELKQIRQHFTK